ncbi:ASCH domain-containing protein [Candidatus Woesearchaeota archaeon]|nr:ASCH domain-containing protein [Candidatus Woesearchaeota archaeon]
MKALCLKEPYASLVLQGKKIIETRIWKTDYRGDILFCCSQNPKSNISGKAFAIVELIECRPMLKKDEKAACCKIYPRANAWLLKNIRPIKPFPIKGQLSLFEIKFKPKK